MSSGREQTARRVVGGGADSEESRQVLPWAADIIMRGSWDRASESGTVQESQ